MIYQARKKRPGSAPIKLAVVVAIIVMLFVLIAPAVQMHREAMSRIECMKNLQQIGQAYHAWVSTNRNTPFPTATWTNTLKPYYVKVGDFLVCPVKVELVEPEKPAAEAATSDYGINGFVGTVKRLPATSSTIFALEWIDAGPFTADPTPASAAEYLAKVQPRHGLTQKRMNILFADGRVDCVDPAVYEPAKAADTHWNVRS